MFALSISNCEGYKKLRLLCNEHRNALDLFTLVAYSFNHQIRFNNAHEFNNPFGKERSSYKWKKISSLLSNVYKAGNTDFTNLNFENFDFAQLTINDFVYCDPPYLITIGTYNDGKRGFSGWGKTQEIYHFYPFLMN